jgi:hypothetical protein
MGEGKELRSAGLAGVYLSRERNFRMLSWRKAEGNVVGLMRMLHDSLHFQGLVTPSFQLLSASLIKFLCQ